MASSTMLSHSTAVAVQRLPTMQRGWLRRGTGLGGAGACSYSMLQLHGTSHWNVVSGLPI